MKELTSRIVSTINLLSDDLMSINCEDYSEEYIKKLALIGDLAIDLVDVLRANNNKAVMASRPKTNLMEN